MVTTTWTIHTKNNGTITASALLGEWPTLTRGKTTPLVFEMESLSGFELLRQYTDYAGAVATGRLQDGSPWYHPQLPTRASVDSPVLGVEPSESLKDYQAEGLWGVVTGGQDERQKPLSTNRIQVEVFVLGEYSDYSDHADVATQLEK